MARAAAAAALGVLLLLCPCFGGGASAQDAPARVPTVDDTPRERVHFEPRAGVQPEPAALSVSGTFALQGNVLRPGTEEEHESGHWLPEGASLRDGVARFRVVAGDKLELGLLVRATPTGDGARIEGYNVHFRSSRVRLERLDEGGITPLTAWESLKGLGSRATLEVYVVAVGEHLLVQIHDGEKERLLETLLAADRRFSSGRVGVRREGGQVPRGGVSRIATAPSCAPLSGPVAAPSRFVTISREALEAAQSLVPALSTLEEMEPASGRGDRVVARIDTGGLLRLACAGHKVRELEVETPLKYLDPEYRAWRGAGVEETATGFVVDRSFKDAAMVNALLEAYAERFPEQTRLVEIGRSVEDRPILALAITRDVSRARDKPTILLNGAHHGNEPLAVEFVIDAVQSLLEHQDDPQVAAWLDDFVIWCVPMVNPDGVEAHMALSARAGRKNRRRHAATDGGPVAERHHGIDLNRNYPFLWGALGTRGSSPSETHMWYRGPKAASEPETRAMMALGDSERFQASISYHTGNVIILAPYTIEGAESPEPNEAWAIGEYVSARMPVHPPTGRRYELASQIYPVDGVDQDWFRHAHGTVALLVEGSNYSFIEHADRTATVRAVRRSWELLLERAQGLAVRGRVLDRQGRAVEAEVRIAEQTLHEGERWTSRCRDGRFARFVTAPGRYTLVARLPDGTEARKEVEVSGRGPVPEVVLVFEAAPEGPRRECRNVVDWPVIETVALASPVAVRLLEATRVRSERVVALARRRGSVGRAQAALQSAAAQARVALEAETVSAREAAAAAGDEAPDDGCGCATLRPPDRSRPHGAVLLVQVLVAAVLLVRRRRGGPQRRGGRGSRARRG